MKTYYPEIEITDKGSQIELRTTVRKEKDGFWYDWLHIMNYQVNDRVSKSAILPDLINNIHKQAYKTVILSKLTKEMLMCPSDLQISEEERLKDYVLRYSR